MIPAPAFHLHLPPWRPYPPYLPAPWAPVVPAPAGTHAPPDRLWGRLPQYRCGTIACPLRPDGKSAVNPMARIRVSSYETPQDCNSLQYLRGCHSPLLAINTTRAAPRCCGAMLGNVHSRQSHRGLSLYETSAQPSYRRRPVSRGGGLRTVSFTTPYVAWPGRLCKGLCMEKWRYDE